MSTTIIDKPKAGTTPVETPRNEKRAERTMVQMQAAAKGSKTTSTKPADCYPSCLDLAADFMARG